MKARPFVPVGASARAFQPRVWLGMQPEDQKVVRDQPPETPCLWGLLVFNGGPELRDLVVEVLPDEDGEAKNRYEVPVLEEGSIAHLFAGGPSDEPPHGLYRLQAKTLEGVEIELESHFFGLERPSHLPTVVGEYPCYPLAPGAPWEPAEYVRVLRESGLGTGEVAATAAALGFNRNVARLLRGVTAMPSAGAAREIAWAAVRSVFGARECDMELESVREMIAEVGAKARDMAAYFIGLSRPLEHVPEHELSLALVPGKQPELYLLNTYDKEWQDVRVRVHRMRWAGEPASLEPLTVEVGRVQPGSAVRLLTLEEHDRLCDLECVVETGPFEPFSATRHRGWFPEGAAHDDETLRTVELLQGRPAQIRRMEVTAIIETPQEDSGPDRLAA